MLNMSQIDIIRESAKKGCRLGEIARATSHDVKTVKKYLEMDDFSPQVPVNRRCASKLDSYKAQIDEWLKDDKHTWRKQQHTAKRIHDRLREETPGYDCSYSLVQRYVKAERQRSKAKANLELIWHPGEAQVDFGEADFCVDGKVERRKYLVLSFPYSNDGFSQVFGGETAECVCQGLKDIFEYIGGVPPLLVFDNASGVGRRVGEKITEAELFSRFRNHYGFSVRFCNPASGWEKGNVERKVAYNRANLFVPIPCYEQIEAYNADLLKRHEEKASELHYKKGLPIWELFETDRSALSSLPARPFDVCRYSAEDADGYGKVTLDGKHHYSTCPEFSNQKVLLGIRAHSIDVLDQDGGVITTHLRRFGPRRTDTIDHRTSLAVLMRNVGAWPNSGLREQAPGSIRDELDRQPRVQLKESLKLLGNLSERFGLDVAISAMEEAVSKDRLNVCDTTVLATRIAGFGLFTEPEPGPDLCVYDDAFLAPEGVLP